MLLPWHDPWWAIQPRNGLAVMSCNQREYGEVQAAFLWSGGGESECSRMTVFVVVSEIRMLRSLDFVLL